MFVAAVVAAGGGFLDGRCNGGDGFALLVTVGLASSCFLFSSGEFFASLDAALSVVVSGLSSSCPTFLGGLAGLVPAVLG